MSTCDAYGSARLTAARRAIAETVDRFEGAFTVEDLVTRTREAAPGSSAQATVYRAVASMLEAGYIERVGDRSGSALYSRCGETSHHHHIVCDGCGRTAPTECPLPLLGAEETGGFVITRHEIVLHGLCPACASRKG